MDLDKIPWPYLIIKRCLKKFFDKSRGKIKWQGGFVVQMVVPCLILILFHFPKLQFLNRLWWWIEENRKCVFTVCVCVFSFSLFLRWWREENQKWCVFIVFRSPPHGCLLRRYLIWRWVGIFENIVSSRYKKHFLWHQYSLIKKMQQ